ncbi:MAG: hypothetical protein ACO37D_12250, partial [Rhodothermales bacterium]
PAANVSMMVLLFVDGLNGRCRARLDPMLRPFQLPAKRVSTNPARVSTDIIRSGSPTGKCTPSFAYDGMSFVDGILKTPHQVDPFAILG